jgi:hypothetical protein
MRTIVCCAAAALLCGCAIHPLPEDVTGVDTFNIVKQIRCETFEASRQYVIRNLARLAGGGAANEAGEPQPPNSLAQRLVEQYEANPYEIRQFSPTLFPGKDYSGVRAFYQVILSTAIAYNFDLTMTEDTNLSNAGVNLLVPRTPKSTLGITTDALRERQNERTFTITDTIGDLLKNLSARRHNEYYCNGSLVQANQIYPIAGHIGVDEMIRTFFDLNFFGNLGAADKSSSGSSSPPGAPSGSSSPPGAPSGSRSPPGAPSGSSSPPAASSGSSSPSGSAFPTMADKLAFTTTIDASLTPMITFSPVGTAFQVANASLTGLAKRTDLHKVTVALATESSAIQSLGSIRNYFFSRRSAEGAPTAAAAPKPPGVFPLSSITGSAHTNAQVLALLAIEQLKIREIIILPGP